MLLTSLDPFVQEFERQVDRVFREAGLNGNGTAMPMDGIRRAEDVVLRFDLPGIDPDSIEVTVDRDVLSVTAHREEEIGDGERPFVRERRMGTFARRVRQAVTITRIRLDHPHHPRIRQRTAGQARRPLQRPVRHRHPRPDRIKQLILRHHPVPMPRQINQKIKHPRLQLDRALPHPHLTAELIDLES